MKPTNKILVTIAVLFTLQICLASALTITNVKSNPEFVKPGDKIILDLQIKNNLENDVTDVTISLDLSKVPFAPYQDSSERNINEIAEDKEKYLSFDLIADSNAESGTYKIPVQISYTINDIEKTGSGLVSLLIDAEPKLEINLENNVLLKGKNNQLNIKIINSGLGNAKFLNIKINDVSGLKVLTSNSVYLGNLDSDDFDTADFTIFISENAGLINLPVTLTYTDARNNQVTEDLSLLLKTYTLKEAKELGLIKTSNTGTMIFGIIILIVLFLVYRWIRKKLRTKNKEV